MHLLTDTILRSPPTNEWIHKMWYIYIREYYLATKRNAVLIHTMWINLENIVKKVTKDHISYDYISMKCSEYVNPQS